MQDPVLLNGKPRCTLIRRLDHGVVVIGPGATTKKEFASLHEAEQFVETVGWVIGISHPTPLNEEA